MCLIECLHSWVQSSDAREALHTGGGRRASAAPPHRQHSGSNPFHAAAAAAAAPPPPRPQPRPGSEDSSPGMCTVAELTPDESASLGRLHSSVGSGTRGSSRTPSGTRATSLTPSGTPSARVHSSVSRTRSAAAGGSRSSSGGAAAAAPPPPPPPAAGEELVQALDEASAAHVLFLGRYRLLGAVHRRFGGQGVVQFAQDHSSGDAFAIKCAPRCCRLCRTWCFSLLVPLPHLGASHCWCLWR